MLDMAAKRSLYIGFRTTEKAREWLEAEAERLGVKLSEVINRVLEAAIRGAVLDEEQADNAALYPPYARKLEERVRALETALEVARSKKTQARDPTVNERGGQGPG